MYKITQDQLKRFKEASALRDSLNTEVESLRELFKANWKEKDAVEPGPLTLAVMPKDGSSVAYKKVVDAVREAHPGLILKIKAGDEIKEVNVDQAVKMVTTPTQSHEIKTVG